MAIAERRELGVTTSAPVVHFTPVEIHVCGVDTSIGGHGRRSVLAFFVGTALSKVDDVLLREIGDVVHCDLRPGRGRLEAIKGKKKSTFRILGSGVNTSLSWAFISQPVGLLS